MATPLWIVEIIKKTFPQRFLLAKMTHLPVFGKIIDKWLFEGDDIVFLPKDVTITVNQPVPESDEQVLPSQVVHHFIEKSRHHWIMNFCMCRAGEKCQDYSVDLGCIFLGEAISGINPRLGRRVSKQEAHEHAIKCREAGLVHLIGRNKLDTVWLNTGPGDRLLTICNCCPCCCLWRMLPQIATKIGKKVTPMPGVRVWVTERCTGCGTCIQGACFVNALHFDGNRASISQNDCRGCGRCVEVCPSQAIEITIEFEDAIEKSIARLTSLVDLS